MDQFITLVDSYGLLVVLSGLIASILCGWIKIPIVKYIKNQNLGEKATTKRITTICTALVAVFSILIIVIWSCATAHSFAPLLTVDLYSKILLSISFAKIIYAMYEGVGTASIKKWVHVLIKYIKNKLENKKANTIVDYVEEIQKILIDELHMPLTDNQKELLKKNLSTKTKSDEQQSS